MYKRQEEDFYISQATVNVDDDNKITDNIVAGRYRGENVLCLLYTSKIKKIVVILKKV